MKYILYIVVAALVIGMAVPTFMHVADKSRKYILVSAGGEADRDKLSETAFVISNRLKTYNSGKFEIGLSPDGKQILVKLSGKWNEATAQKLMLSPGLITFKKAEEENMTQKTSTSLLDNRDVETATVSDNGIQIVFHREAAEKWRQITHDNIGKQIIVMLDNEIILDPVIREEIPGGKSEIAGNFTPDEVKFLLTMIKNGMLPVKLKMLK